MKEIKKEVVTEEVIAYELTKEELEKIKRDERNRGWVEGFADIRDYIWFCKDNSAYEANIGWTIAFTKDIIEFFGGYQDYIENKYNYSFKEYLRKIKNKHIK